MRETPLSQVLLLHNAWELTTGCFLLQESSYYLLHFGQMPRPALRELCTATPPAYLLKLFSCSTSTTYRNASSKNRCFKKYIYILPRLCQLRRYSFSYHPWETQWVVHCCHTDCSCQASRHIIITSNVALQPVRHLTNRPFEHSIVSRTAIKTLTPHPKSAVRFFCHLKCNVSPCSSWVWISFSLACLLLYFQHKHMRFSSKKWGSNAISSLVASQLLKNQTMAFLLTRTSTNQCTDNQATKKPGSITLRNQLYSSNAQQKNQTEPSIRTRQ